MNPFKGRHFQRDIILWAVRWYCKYGISYRELQEMLAERGVNVDHSTIYRWVQRYAPEMEKRLRWYWRNPSDLCPWHMDETYVKVNGRWAYLYRAVDSRGRTVDFYLSSRRNSKAAYRFLGKILNNVKKWQIPRFINTDKAPAYGRALALLKREGRCPSDVEHRQIKYRNNVIECDHGKLKRACCHCNNIFPNPYHICRHSDTMIQIRSQSIQQICHYLCIHLRGILGFLC